jgi:hypothetical protein
VLLRPYRQNLQEEATGADSYQGPSKTLGNFPVRHRSEQGILRRLPQLIETIAGWNMKTLAPRMHGLNGPVQFAGHDFIRHCANQGIFVFAPAGGLGIGIAGGNSQFLAVELHGFHSPFQTPCCFLVGPASEELFFRAGPSAMRGGCRNAQIAPGGYYRTDGAFYAPRDDVIGSGTQQLHFLFGPLAVVGEAANVADFSFLPDLPFRASNSPGCLIIGHFPEESDFRRDPRNCRKWRNAQLPALPNDMRFGAPRAFGDFAIGQFAEHRRFPFLPRRGGRLLVRGNALP